MELVLSTFCNAIDLLGRGFQEEGFCVVQAGDIKFGQDIKDFHVPAGRFDGVIGGPSCTQFSGLNRNPDFAKGVELLNEFCRVVIEAQPKWFLMENVTRVPDIAVDGYTVQRFHLSPRECGEYAQSRNRAFQFGFKEGEYLTIKRDATRLNVQSCVTASEGKQQERRTFSDVCELQGLPRNFKIEGFTQTASYDAIGNAVHLAVARRCAAAIRERPGVGHSRLHTLCICGCGRFLAGRQKSATAACRKRLEKRRKSIM